MRILLDECVDRRFARELPDHDIRTVPQMGWSGIKNGALMKLAEADFDIFITVDRNLSYQQNLSMYDIGLIVLQAVSNRYQDLAPFAPQVLDSLANAKPGSAVVIRLNPLR